MIQQCVDTIIDNLFFVFRAILKLNTYPTQWLNILTIVLRKPRKPAYNVAKAYWPIGLLDTLGKLFSTLIADDISYLTEKHQLLLSTQFGGQPGHCTTDAMHLVTQKIKDTLRWKKVASILFLDIQAAFPHTVKECLLHNMRNRWVPSVYIKLIDNMLSNRKTQLSFDNFTSNPTCITNGTTSSQC